MAKKANAAPAKPRTPGENLAKLAGKEPPRADIVKIPRSKIQRIAHKNGLQRLPATPAADRVTVDYPQAGAVVTSPVYTIRIAAAQAAKVDIFIDAGPWQPCRFSVGYWWYDWSGYGPGKHRLKAQAGAEDGRIAASRVRLFVVASA